MPDFYDDEKKAIDAKYNDLRALLATIGAGDKPLRAVKPQLMVTATGTKDAPEVTAALVVALETGGDVITALTTLESSLRIATFGVHADEVRDDPALVSVGIPLMEEEEPTLVEVVEGLDGDADINGRVH